jgi:hypothetical protein
MCRHAKSNVRVRIQSLDFRDEAPELLPEFVPGPAGALTPPPKLPPPHAQHFVPERLQSLLVARYGVISERCANHRLEPLRRVRDPLMQALAQLLPNLLQPGCHALADRLPQHQEAPRRVILPSDVSETPKVEGFRLPYPTLSPPLSERHIARILPGTSSPDATPARASARAPADPPGTFRPLPGTGIRHRVVRA